MTIQQRIRTQKQRDLASFLQISQGFLSDIARNKKAPSVRTIVALADALGVSSEEIVESVREWARVDHASNDNGPSIHMESVGGESGGVSP